MTILVMHLRSVSFIFVACGLELDNWSDLHGHTHQIIESRLKTIFQPYDGNWVPFVYHVDITLDIRWICFHALLYFTMASWWSIRDPWQDPCKLKAKPMGIFLWMENYLSFTQESKCLKHSWSEFEWYIHKHVEHIRYKPNPLRMDATNPKLTTDTHAKSTLQLRIKSNLDHNMTFGRNKMCI